jgi:hypothetical protein
MFPCFSELERPETKFLFFQFTARDSETSGEDGECRAGGPIQSSQARSRLSENKLRQLF